MQDGSSAVAADLLEDGLSTASARSLVAQLLANVIATLQQAAALTCADVLGLEAIVDWSWCGVQGTLLPLAALSLSSLALAGAAALVAGMASTIEIDAAYAHALRRLLFALMADRVR